ncbi:hypothetical protein P691DRAFT_804698 [Macrolepiota fuliginosa MF-IS2]|uniref:Uncharacterized protein n=1 Tax=Macrolepiota fuliginosa MF-IS2 TaxID=1400762 RepID=A0A9P5X7N9_9AGAR|nr:hypothetical protein P691DRAFT_804698 [Macrolepiota fuliginosa MF-IS2]
MDNPTFTTTEIRSVSRVVTDVLTSAGFSCCLVGSAAGHELGITRTPNDVDVLVMMDKNPDELKDYLAAYRVLWYKFPFRDPPGVPEKSCRIDLFTPGMIHLPRIPQDKIIYTGSKLPIMPFFPVVLHKIQAWKAHLASTKPWATVKQRNDVSDISDLLRMATTTDERFENQAWLGKWFLDEALDGVREYIAAHPDTASGWAKLGFEVKLDGSN